MPRKRGFGVKLKPQTSKGLLLCTKRVVVMEQRVLSIETQQGKHLFTTKRFNQRRITKRNSFLIRSRVVLCTLAQKISLQLFRCFLASDVNQTLQVDLRTDAPTRFGQPMVRILFGAGDNLLRQAPCGKLITTVSGNTI